jgi:uncharacterized protein (TIGR00730 family)
MARELPLTGDEELLAGPPAPTSERDAPLLERSRAELAAGFDALAGVGPAVTVFGSARASSDDPDYDLARAVAAQLGSDGFAIITGGGPGIMEAANRGARDAGSLSIGLSIELPFPERINPYVDLPLRFHHFFTRKVMFVRYASAFVVFPGGSGTLDEVFELVTLMATGKIHNFPVVLVRRSYWEPMLAWLRDTVLAEGKISAGELELVAVADDVAEVRELVGAATGRN